MGSKCARCSKKFTCGCQITTYEGKQYCSVCILVVKK